MRDTTGRRSGRTSSVWRPRAAVGLAVLAAALTLAGCSTTTGTSSPVGSGLPADASAPTGSGPASTGGPTTMAVRTIELVAVEPVSDGELDATSVIITERLRALDLEGSAEVVNGEILVHLDPKDEQVLLDLVTSSPRLLFRPVLATLVAAQGPGTAVPPEASDPKATITLSQPRTDVAYTLGPSLVGGEAIESASAANDEHSGQWIVNTILTEPGIRAFNAVTARCYARDATCPLGQLAIVVDGRIISAPSINAETFSRDQIQIMGGFREHEARTTADAMRSGLPVELKVRG